MSLTGFDPAANFAIAELASGIAAGATSMTVASGLGALFPSPATDGAYNGFIFCSSDFASPWQDPNKEAVRASALSTDTFTIARAQEGTADVNHNTGGKTYSFYMSFSKKPYDDLVAATKQTVFRVAQTGHGFSAGDIIKATSTANTYAKAQADSAANAAVVGYVMTVIDTNNFIYCTEGIVETGVPAATAGTVYYLSPTTAGALTATEPSTVGQVSKPLLTVLQSATRAIFTNQRGNVIASASGGSVDNAVQDFRLTLTTGVPVMTSAVTAATTVYLTPYKGNGIALYDGAAWGLHTSAQVSASLSGLTANTNYDVFAYDNGGTLTLDLVAWTNDTTRATALVYQDGVLVKTGATGRRYIGTIRITGNTGECEYSFGGTGAGGTEAKLFVWNYNNRVTVSAQVSDSTDSWSCPTGGWRAADNSATYRASFVIGVSEESVSAQYSTFALQSALGYTRAGIGYDVTNAHTGIVGTTGNTSNNSQERCQITAFAEVLPAAGAHFVSAIENSITNSHTVYGDNNEPTTYQAGLVFRARM